MIRTVALALAVFCCCVALLLPGCLGKGSNPSRYYVLHEIAQPVGDPGPDLFTEDNALLQIGPISLPRYLDRSQIVSRSSDNQVDLAEFDRWSEPLHNSFTRVLAGNLGALLPTDDILVYPNRRSTGDTFYQLKMEVARFDGRREGSVTLEARWIVVGQKNNKVMPQARSLYTEPVAGSDYTDYVAALNRTMEKLSREIASKIRVAVREQVEH